MVYLAAFWRYSHAKFQTSKLMRSRSLKVTDLGTKKAVHGFLLVINSNLYSISHHFWVIAKNLNYATLLNFISETVQD